MEYIKEKELNKFLRNNNLKIVGSIHYSGSIKGMNKLFGWKKYKKIRSGNYIYAIN